MPPAKVNVATPSPLTPEQVATVMAAANQAGAKGKGQFNIVETKELLQIIKDCLPIGSDGWQQVADEYNTIAVAHPQMSEREKVSVVLFCFFPSAWN